MCKGRRENVPRGRLDRQFRVVEDRELLTGSGGETMPAASARMSGAADEASPAEWTEALACKFPAGMEPMARRMALHVWQAGAADIQRTDSKDKAMPRSAAGLDINGKGDQWRVSRGLIRRRFRQGKDAR